MIQRFERGEISGRTAAYERLNVRREPLESTYRMLEGPPARPCPTKLEFLATKRRAQLADRIKQPWPSASEI